MLDIIFIILVFLVFLIGANNYESFESDTKKKVEMYQSNQVNALTEGLNKNITGTITGISTMVGNITGEMDRIVEMKNKIEDCAGCFKYCGKRPEASTCYGDEKCVTDFWGNKVCDTPKWPCTNWISDCGPKIPKWNCTHGIPSGFSKPGPPSKWKGIFEEDCS